MTDRTDRKGAAGGGARKRQRETAADKARIGTVIASSYRIDEIIGRGAIGAVFGGVHLRLERPLAIKFVDPTLVDDPEIRARFKREAKIAAQIRSSHAVEVFDYGVGEDGAPYLVMERLYGEDLHQRMLREGRLSVDRALRIAKQVCRALGAAHGTGIVHRDLKPENVFLVERDGEQEFVKVVDFGLSTFVQSDDTRLTRAGQSVGTPLYMAPEQAGAHAFDARVDVYSLGVLIFEMTTGRLPHEAATLQALLVALATQPPRSIRYYAPELPVELDDLVLRFIARDPRVRPKSAAAALAEIIALEDRLTARYGAPGSPQRLQAAQFASPSVKVRVNGNGLDDGAFDREVQDHVEELRRTGRLSTVDSIPPTERGPDSIPVSSANERTRPMDRREIDEMMGAPPRPSDDSIRVAPRAAGRPASSRPSSASVRPSPSSPKKSSTLPPPRSLPPERTTPRKVPRATPPPQAASRTEDEIEEDSRVFYGRVAKDGTPVIQIKQQGARVDARLDGTTQSPSARRGGPPIALIVVALCAFVLVAALVVLRALR